MQALHNILVVLDPHLQRDAALERARELGAASGAHLHLLLCARTAPTAELAELAEALRGDGLEVSSHCAWLEDPAHTILDAQRRTQSQLVIKQHQRDSGLRRFLLLPEDWKLLRLSPVPVLLVKHPGHWRGGNVLAAVDAGSEDEIHRHLHDGVVALAAQLSTLVDGRLHLMSSYPAPLLADGEPTLHLQQRVEQRYREGCARYARNYPLNDEQVHLLQGPADVNIPLLAQRLAAVLTVIGSVARSGLSGLLIGNTAEALLDSLESDILVLKPSVEA